MDNKTPRVGVVFFCHDGAGNVLMSFRSKGAKDENGCWDIGGGGVEHGESVEEALAREIREEYSTEILRQEFLGFRNVVRGEGDKETHWVTLDFKVHVDRQKVRNGEPNKFDSVEWFTTEHLPTPLHSQLPIFLEKYKEQLRLSLE